MRARITTSASAFGLDISRDPNETSIYNNNYVYLLLIDCDNCIPLCMHACFLVPELLS